MRRSGCLDLSGFPPHRSHNPFLLGTSWVPSGCVLNCMLLDAVGCLESRDLTQQVPTININTNNNGPPTICTSFSEESHRFPDHSRLMSIYRRVTLPKETSGLASCGSLVRLVTPAVDLGYHYRQNVERAKLQCVAAKLT
jgi:hypothetical protein